MTPPARSGAPRRLAAAAVLLLTVGPDAPAQNLSDIDRMRGREMLRMVRRQVQDHYYDPAFKGVDLAAAAARADSEIRVARSNSQIFTAIAEFLQSLDDSHTWLIPPGRTADIEYGWALGMIGDSCYVMAVAPGSRAAASGLRVGDRVIALDGYLPSRRTFSLLPHVLRWLSPRPSVRFELAGADGSRRTVQVPARVTPKPPIVDLGDLIRRVENLPPDTNDIVMLDDSLRILRLGRFGGRRGIDDLMRHARNARAVILDLRGNGGGSVEALVRLVGHVFDRRVVIGTRRSRRGSRAVESRPVGRPYTGPLFVLIDSRSASAAEVFAHLVQSEARGMVLGDRSAGAVMESSLHFLDWTAGHRATVYAVSVTQADWIMPDGARLEGRGVVPDALRLPGAADLAAGRDPVLALALTMAGFPVSPEQAGTMLPRRDVYW